MSIQVSELAFNGNWDALLRLLRSQPYLANMASASKGYTPLHQAAWHGASLDVVGKLLAIGADRRLATFIKKQTAQKIAREIHPERLDLEYVLNPGPRSLSQLMRKIAADSPEIFDAYDGNQIVCDRLINYFSTDLFNHPDQDVETRLHLALQVLIGVPHGSSCPIVFQAFEGFDFKVSKDFWRERFFPILREHMSRAHQIPIEEKWAVMSDLFDPAPTQWGLRGDPFLWMEMRHALCHVGIPRQPAGVAKAVSSAFSALTGVPLERSTEVFVQRFDRGGMSSGMVSGAFWSEEFIPLLEQRSSWLQGTWQR